MERLLRIKASDSSFDHISRWLYCVCIVNFDVDVGQTIQLVCPQDRILTDSERWRICYLSFPDSHSACVDNTQHHFRFTSTSTLPYFQKFSSIYDRYLQSLTPLPGACFGYVYFRQQKDSTAKRNYSQKSVVAISWLPFDGLFYEVCKKISLLYFEKGEFAIERALRDISNWPAPEAGKNLTLHLLDSCFNLRIPVAVDSISDLVLSPPRVVDSACSPNEPCSGLRSPFIPMRIPSRADTSPSCRSLHDMPFFHTDDSNDEDYDILPDTTEIAQQQMELTISLEKRNYFHSFSPVLSHLQRIWELVLTAQPLLVMGSNPSQTSQMVQSLVSCISPLAFAQDYRPFFTIHDPEFKDISRPSSVSISILGVTNPFFSKFIGDWPNVIRLGTPKHMEKKKPVHLLTDTMHLEDMKPGLYCRSKPFLKRDGLLLKRIKKALAGSPNDDVMSGIIEDIFQQLTMSFLCPLEHYLSGLMPLRKNLSPHKGVPELNCFNMEDFFRSLHTSGPKLTCNIKGNWVGLYKLFFSGPNFVSWLGRRESQINLMLQSLHLDIILGTDFDLWLRSRSELEIVDMIAQLNQKVTNVVLLKPTGHLSIIDAITKKIYLLMSALPADLLQVVKQSTSGTGAAVSTVSSYSTAFKADS